MRNIIKFFTIEKSIFTFLMSALLLASCEQYTFDPPTIDPGVQISFQSEIQPLFTSKCIGCHSSGNRQPYLDAANSYTSLTTGGYISDDPENSPETSILYQQITTGSGHVSILNDLQKLTILEWIRQGANNN